METRQRYSPIADSLASRPKWISGRPLREHVTMGIILVVFGVIAFGISPWLAWFTVASGLLLLTWHTRMQGTWRGLRYFFVLLPVLHWLNNISEYLFHETLSQGFCWRVTRRRRLSRVRPPHCRRGLGWPHRCDSASAAG